MSQATANTQTVGQIQADNGESYPDSVYQETRRATGNQQWVADHWADGDLPTHSVSGDAVKLYTGTENFVGLQYPDGRGKLKHYNHIQAIRTYSGLVIGDSSCYGKGWAYCSYPREKETSIDLTTLKANLRTEDESIYDITKIEGEEVTFESGRVYHIGDWEWSVATPDPIESDILGV